MNEIVVSKQIKMLSFDKEKDMHEKILNLIIDGKADKILFKGDPNLINYKLIRKIVSFINTGKNENLSIREVFLNFVKNSNIRHLLIIKK